MQHPLNSDKACDPHRVRIGGIEIGPGRPVCVVAEAGVNHDGDLDAALRLVDAAHECGADAVKFQIFRAEALTTATVSTATYQSNATQVSCQQSMLQRLELSTDDFARIAGHCTDRGVMFVATPFGPADVDRLFEIGAAAIKIASTDIVDIPLLEQACRGGLPLIVSTGAATESEILRAVESIKCAGAGNRLALLHCVSSYPTSMEDANLTAIKTLRERFRTLVGYSDHTRSTLTGAIAVGLGACVIEKHLTLDREAHGPDHSMSLDPNRMTTYVRNIREAELAMGDGGLAPRAVEEEVGRLARKRLVASRDIAAGEMIDRDMLMAKRSDRGLTPDHIEQLLGRRTRVFIAADSPVERERLC